MKLRRTITAGLAALTLGAGAVSMAPPASAGGYSQITSQGHDELTQCTKARQDHIKRLNSKGFSVFEMQHCHSKAVSRTTDQWFYSLSYRKLG